MSLRADSPAFVPRGLAPAQKAAAELLATAFVGLIPRSGEELEDADEIGWPEKFDAECQVEHFQVVHQKVSSDYVTCFILDVVDDFQEAVQQADVVDGGNDGCTRILAVTEQGLRSLSDPEPLD